MGDFVPPLLAPIDMSTFRQTGLGTIGYLETRVRPQSTATIAGDGIDDDDAPLVGYQWMSGRRETDVVASGGEQMDETAIRWASYTHATTVDW